MKKTAKAVRSKASNALGKMLGKAIAARAGGGGIPVGAAIGRDIDRFIRYKGRTQVTADGLAGGLGDSVGGADTGVS